MRADVLLIYDGDCRFCRWGIDWIARLDRETSIRFCPFGHPTAENELLKVSGEIRYESMHAVVSGTLYSATDAARVVLERLPLGALCVMLRVHRLYPFIARHRAFFGRLSPERPAPVRCGNDGASSFRQ